MSTCESCQAQLLNHLFGLLDDGEQQQFQAHVSGCAACQSALERAQEQRMLLAMAAKTEFPEVRFTAPGAPASEPTRILPRPAQPRPWGRYALAASILLVFGGGGALGFFAWQQRHRHMDEARGKFAQAKDAFGQFQSRSQADQKRINQDIRAIQKQIQQITADWDKEADKAERTIQDQKVELFFRGPKSIQAGARNEYQIEMRSKNNVPLKKDLTVSVVNPVSKEVFFKKQIANQGTFQVDLPRDLPLKAGVNLALLVKGELDQGQQVEVSEQLPLVASLFMTHLTTDRPMYRPGEVVRFRSLTLERFSLKPAREEFQVRFRITAPSNAEIFKAEGAGQVTQADGKPILGPDGKAVRGLAAGQFQLPANLPGGEYTLFVSDAGNRFPEEKRKFLVNRYQAPRLNKELVFTRKSYGPGEEVEAQCKVARVEGGAAVAGQSVQATLLVDGSRQDLKGLRSGMDGKVTVKFKLPDKIDRGDASLSVEFRDGGGNPETILRPVPVVLKKLLIDFYPEGGDLVTGVSNRVYFQVRTPLGKPAELQGRIVDRAGKAVAKVQTQSDDDEPGVNQGMGLFTFVPQSGQTYELRIDSPIGIEGRHALPAVKADGVVLNIPAGVVEDKIEIVLHNGTKDRKLLVGAYCRGRLLDASSLDVAKNQAKKVTLKTAAGVSGVYRVTVFEKRGGAGDNNLVPVAERLIYRRPVENLEIHIDSDKKEYSPGDSVKLSLKTKNEKKTSAPAILLVSVVDLSVLKLADEKTARSMPAHFFLTTEIQKPEDLEYADFLLSDHPKALAALDLLLGTQGWRRFAEQNPAQLLKKHPEAGQRLLAQTGQAVQDKGNSAKLVLDKVDQKFAPQFVELEKGLAKREKEEVEIVAENLAKAPLFNARIQTAQRQVNEASSELAAFPRLLGRVALGVLVLVLLLAGFGGLAIGLARISRNEPRAVRYLAGGIGLLLLLFVGSAGGTLLFLANRVEEQRRAEGMAGRKAVMAEAPMAAHRKERALKDNAPDAKHKDFDQDQKKAEMAKGKEMEMRPMLLEPKGEMLKVAPPGPGDDVMAQVKNGQAKDEKAFNLGLAVKEEMPNMAGAMPKMAAGGLNLGGQKGIGGPVPGQPGGFAIPPDLRDRQLRQDGKFKDIVLRRVRRYARAKLAALAEPFVVREYAHQHKPALDNVRRDFTETLHWHPLLVLANGSGEVRFDLSDATGQFQVLAMGHTLDGRLGSNTLNIASRLPYSLEPKVPDEVTSSDKIIIPVTIANDSDQSRGVQIDVSAKGLTPLGPVKQGIGVDSHTRQRLLFRFQPAIVAGDVTLSCTGSFDALPGRLPITTTAVDRLERSFKIVPEGFPVVGAHSDMLEGVARQEIILPEHWVKGTLKCQVQVYPSTLADLQKGLEALMREPGGCFEQSSSSNYPNVLILNYLKESEQNRPEIEKQARQYLASGYQKLTSFECIDPQTQTKRQGYEWFGQTAPPHEALTAYGLLQFKDMAKVHTVDEAMVERTRKYLLDQRDGKGGFKRNTRAIDTFGRAPEDITNAYIVWSLTEGGNDNVETELEALLGQAKDSKDPYFLALVGNSLINRSKTKDGLAILQKLIDLQKADGHLQGTRTSITGSGGRDLQIETTALAILAWLKANRPEFNTAVQKAVTWIGKQRGGYGGFGATQSTILALKALIAHARANRKPAEGGELKLFAGDGQQPIASKTFAAGSQEPLIVSIPRDGILKPGKNKVKVEITGKNAFPYTLTWSYRTLKPANPDNCPVHLTTRLSVPRRAGLPGVPDPGPGWEVAREGETVRLQATVTNKSGKGQGMTVAILGLPGGLSLPEDFSQLKDMARLRDNGTRPGKISFWEIRGRELVLYWRELGPDQKIDVSIDLICRIPGEYRGPASRAYLYYNGDRKFWVDPVGVNIQPK